MQDAYPGVLDGHEGHMPAEKLLSTTLYTPYLAEIWKIVCLDPSLLCASFTQSINQSKHISIAPFVASESEASSSKHNNNKELCITFNFCKTVSISSMALATVNIDKIIKATSASSYVQGGPKK